MQKIFVDNQEFYTYLIKRIPRKEIMLTINLPFVFEAPIANPNQFRVTNNKDGINLAMICTLIDLFRPIFIPKYE